MFKKLIIYLLLISGLSVGLLSLYRASLKFSNMKIVEGTVVNKKISFFKSRISGRHYSLVFKLRDIPNEIAINLGTENEAKMDSTFYFVDTAKTYKFFIDPTTPTVHGVRTGVTRIDYDGKTIFKASNNLNFYGGLFVSILSLGGLILVIYRSKKVNRS